MRAANLERKLQDKKEDAKPDAANSARDKIGKSTKGKNDDELDMTPIEFGGKNDYQLGQAMNLLKAMQVLKR